MTRSKLLFTSMIGCLCLSSVGQSEPSPKADSVGVQEHLEKVISCLLAEANDKFFPKVVVAELDFVRDAGGKVSSLDLHQNGRDLSMPRLNDAEAKRIADESTARTALAVQRFNNQKPTPGAEAAIRQSIADILAGKPKYDRMSPGLADVTGNNFHN